MTEPTAPAPFAPPAALAALVRDGALDAELAALLSLTIEGAIPLVVAGPDRAGRTAVRDALMTVLPTDRRLIRLAGADEGFAWMPEAGELGWRSHGPVSPGLPGAVMVAHLEETDAGTWGEAAHLAIRALTAGYSLIASMNGRRLEDVLTSLAAPPVAASEDELARLGVVLLLAEPGPRGPARVAAAHYLRPVARDPGGHVQRLPPAVLAARNDASGGFDHFAWGVTAELAARTGRRPIALEREQAQRAAAISAVVRG